MTRRAILAGSFGIALCILLPAGCWVWLTRSYDLETASSFVEKSVLSRFTPGTNRLDPVHFKNPGVCERLDGLIQELLQPETKNASVHVMMMAFTSELGTLDVVLWSPSFVSGPGRFLPYVRVRRGFSSWQVVDCGSATQGQQKIDTLPIQR
ncbi:MAG: hypothetical protein ACKVX7_15280 [Planctomycetota bacterium]